MSPCASPPEPADTWPDRPHGNAYAGAAAAAGQPAGGRWALVFAGGGGIALAVQVYLLREFMVALQGDETAVGLGLAAWLAGIALGALLARWLVGARASGAAALALALLALEGWAGLLLARLGRGLLEVPPGELVPLGPALWLALLVFVLPGLLVGAGFVALAGAAVRAGAGAARAIGRLYVFEATGSLIAGLIVSLVTIPLLHPLTGLSLVLALMLAAAAPAARARLIGGRWLIPALGVAAMLAALPTCAGRVEAATQRMRFALLVPGQPLLDWEDTPYEHIAIGGGEVRVEYASGQYVTSFPDPFEDESRAHRLMLLAERPTRVLAFGGLETGALRFCLRHPVRQLDLIFQDRREFELIRRHLDPLDREALSDQRVRLVFDDLRRFLQRETDAYDLILLLQPDPATLLLARNATVELQRLVSRRLGPRGTYVMRLSVGANVQAGETGIMGAALTRSLQQVFEVVRAAPGPDGLLIAGHSADAVMLDPVILAERWRDRGIQSEVFVAELLPWLFPPERSATLLHELEKSARQVEPTTDNRPVAFIHALTMRQQLAGSAWARLLQWAAGHPAWLGLAVLLPSLLGFIWQLARGAHRPRRHVAWHATLVTGACGMAWSLLLFFSFQSRVGVLYSQLGALAALFMLGLALGGAYSARRPSLFWAQRLVFANAVLLTLSFILFDQLDLGRTVVALCHALLLGLAGMATGAVFPAAAHSWVAGGVQGRAAAAWAELADHGGGALAALVTAVLYVPVLGLVKTAALSVGLQGLVLAASAHAVRSAVRAAGSSGQAAPPGV